MGAQIGNCDTCWYILKCTRAGVAKRLMGGCPSNLLEEYRRDKAREKRQKP